MKIAMIGHKTVPSRRGGIELVITTLAPNLVKSGDEVVCYNRKGCLTEEEYLSQIKDSMYEGVQLREAWSIKGRGIQAVIASFTAALQATLSGFDVIHFHALGPCTAMWIPKLFGKKCVATVHGLDWKREKWNNGWGAKYIKLGERTMVRCADEIIVLSEGLKQYYQENYGRETVNIPNGVFRADTVPANQITEKFGLEKDRYFLLLSRLVAEKGVHFCIDAYQQMKTDKKLVIAGDVSDTVDYVKKIKQKAQGNPNIIFTGFVSGRMLEELYSNAYAYVLPSTVEGMPLSLLEALSYGNAVICSDIAENTDVIGDCGVSFRSADVDDLRNKLQDFIDQPQVVYDLKARAADYICAKYSWDDVTARTREVYRRALKKQK